MGQQCAREQQRQNGNVVQAKSENSSRQMIGQISESVTHRQSIYHSDLEEISIRVPPYALLPFMVHIFLSLSYSFQFTIFLNRLYFVRSAKTKGEIFLPQVVKSMCQNLTRNRGNVLLSQTPHCIVCFHAFRQNILDHWSETPLDTMRIVAYQLVLIVVSNCYILKSIVWCWWIRRDSVQHFTSPVIFASQRISNILATNKNYYFKTSWLLSLCTSLIC